MVKIALALLLLPAFNSRPVHLKPLPAQAKITVEPQHWLATSKPDPTIKCPLSQPLTERQIRRMFATYHVLREMEYHDDYAQIDCVTEGDIIVNGKKFRYMAQPINILITDWPDGTNRTLGGKHSDDSVSQ